MHLNELYYLKRPVAMSIVLSIVTCSIYGWYWLYQMLSGFYRLNNQPNTAGMDILLSLVTCGIYFIYLMYKLGKLESAAHQNYNMPHRDDSLMYLLLALFTGGIGIYIVYGIVQSNLNLLADRGTLRDDDDDDFGGFNPTNQPPFTSSGNGPRPY